MGSDDIDPNLCTHFNYAFAVVRGYMIVPIRELRAKLDTVTPSPKLFLAVGGYTHGPDSFSNMAASRTGRRLFVATSIDYLREHKFDGLDIDWEYPGQVERGGREEDYDNFPKLLQERRTGFEEQGLQTGQARLQLSLAVTGGKKTTDNAYDIPKIAQSVDYVLVMAYDFYGAFPQETITGHNAPLYHGHDDVFSGTYVYRNVHYATLRWLENGTPQDKLVVGIPSYGRCFVLPDYADPTTIGQNFTSGCNANYYTKEIGFLSYYEVCEHIDSVAADQLYWDDEQKASFLNKTPEWISYDNEQSVREKVTFLKERRLAGAMLWTLDFDDYTGKFCGAGDYPLLRTIDAELQKPDPDEIIDWNEYTTTPPPTTTETTETTGSSAPTSEEPSTGSTGSPSVEDYVIFCYFTNWAQWRTPPAKFLPEDIDPTLCTHYNYAFARLGDDYMLHPYEEKDAEFYKIMRSVLDSVDPPRKMLLAVGGSNHGPKPFSDMVKDPTSRAIFIDASIAYLRAHYFDGLELDWQYPGEVERGGRPEDYENFPLLLQELLEAFEEEVRTTSRERLLLSVAVGAGMDAIDVEYDIQNIARNVDYVLLMAYNFFVPAENANMTGHNAPLYDRQDDQLPTYPTSSVHWATKRWLENGTPQKKLVVGVSLSGYCFHLSAGSDGNMIGQPFDEPCPGGLFTATAGFYSYYELCDEVLDGHTPSWDDQQKVPYIVARQRWISYDNDRSLYEKVMFIKERRLGGAMIWALDYDDFSGVFCESGQNPMQHSVNKTLRDWDPEEVIDWIQPTVTPNDTLSTLTSDATDSTSSPTDETTETETPVTNATEETPLTDATGTGTPLTDATETGTPLTDATGTGTPLTDATQTGTPPTDATTEPPDDGLETAYIIVMVSVAGAVVLVIVLVPLRCFVCKTGFVAADAHQLTTISLTDIANGPSASNLSLVDHQTPYGRSSNDLLGTSSDLNLNSKQKIPEERNSSSLPNEMPRHSQFASYTHADEEFW
ncbi:PREDICTED: probable chitinase 3 [Priapulus caudatus]|uniref:Probable chitinase 3 n=1 Tax=Priapulus caudatus TaxID=37621 RepID=A0ABM1EI98_PRICU|nr:PREDICTED: probable chitinase 3 [Priapulus caudatus]